MSDLVDSTFPEMKKKGIPPVAKLTTAERNALPTKDFAGPNRTYPVPDKSHAAAAKSRASQFAGPKLKAKIDAKADKKLGAKVGPSKRG